MQPAQVSRRLKLRQLDTLLAVAQSGSMAKAAESLSVTQPVVSKSIADLEATLGVRLFDRTTQGVEPTLYGRALIERSVAIFNDLRTSVTELQFLSDSTAGELRIGSSETLSVGMLGVIIDRLSRSYPRLYFEVVLGGGANPLPLDDLRARNIDLIIGRLPITTPEDIETIFLYDDISRVVAGANNQFTRRRRVQISELINEPWCGTSFDSFPFSVVAEACRAAGLPVPHHVVMARSLGIRNSLLASGRFLTVYPTSVLHYFGAKDVPLKRVPVNLAAKPYPIGIVTLKKRTLNPAAQRFIDCAREVSAEFVRRRPLEADRI